MTDLLTHLLPAILGGGFVAIINAIAQRSKVKAEANSLDQSALQKSFDTLSEATTQLLENSQQAVKTSQEKICSLEARILVLENKLAELSSDVADRDLLIDKLQKENISLRQSLKRLEKTLGERETMIELLTGRIRELEDQVVKLRQGDDK